ncbi:MAG: hypothetical protein ISS48_03825 [Candidatus Aenigmarchaeota archaeon]|nr:hypothetical protein [Candidatus Aenigmarchaeota archaeon]
MHVIIFTLIFLALDAVMNVLSAKLLKFLGIDFLFFASWLAGINYGIGPGIVVSLILLGEHALLHMTKSRFIAFSFPAQIGAVLLGHFLGMSGFFISLVVYQVVNTVLMLIIGGLGPFFVTFIVVNSVFNVVLHRIWLMVG